MSVKYSESSSSSSSSSSASSAGANWSFIKHLGKGGFGLVSLYASKSEGLMAMKQLADEDKENQHMKSVMENECKIHQAVSDGKHPNIIRLLEIREESGNLQLFMEFARGGCLADKIGKGDKLGVHMVQHYFRQLVEGLNYMHSLGLVHRDIKPENLLLTATDVLRIADFGLAGVSRHEGLEQLFDIDEGTPEYMAPEIGKGKYNGEPTDVWAAGITFMELMTGDIPWSRANEDSPRYQLWKKRDADSKQPWTLLDFRAQGLLRLMLQDKPQDRFTIKEVANHLWLRQRFRNPKRRKKVRNESSDDEDD